MTRSNENEDGGWRMENRVEVEGRGSRAKQSHPRPSLLVLVLVQFVLGFRLSRTIKPAFDPIFGLGGRAIGADAVLDGDAAALVLAERRVNQAVVVADAAVNDGEVFLLDGAGFPDFAEFAGGFGIFGDETTPLVSRSRRLTKWVEG
jgi:hypothetical protein